MLSYKTLMPNTKSAQKAIRSSDKKNKHNLIWKRKIKTAVKSVEKGILAKETPEALIAKTVLLQKILDKAAKEKVIHKNKANRLKSKYAKKISVQVVKPASAAPAKKSTRK
jgi:small subunit ribosomal protein S20